MSSTFLSTSAVTGVTTLCSGDFAGIFPASGGAYVEGIGGDLNFCASGNLKEIAIAPTGGSTLGYWGMGGVKTSAFGLVLVLTDVFNSGFWICKHATTLGCGSKSNFIHLPSTFCS